MANSMGLEQAPSEVGVYEPDSPQPDEPKSHQLPCCPHMSIGARPGVEVRYEDRDECPVGVNQLHVHPFCSSGVRLGILSPVKCAEVFQSLPLCERPRSPVILCIV